MKIIRVSDRGIDTPVTLEDLKRLNDDYAWMHICVTPFRDGAVAFMRILELTYYTPGLPSQDKYLLHMVTIADLPMTMVSIPIADRSHAECVASSLCMRLADGVPHIASGGKWHIFPMNSRRVYTLEATRDVKPGLQGKKLTADAEKALVDGYEREHINWLIRQPRRWMDGRWWTQLTRIEDAPPSDKIGSILQESLNGIETFWYLTIDQLTPEEKVNGYLVPGSVLKSKDSNGS